MADQNREVLLRRKQVEERTGLARSSIYALIQEGKFPKPIPLTERTVAWAESSIDAWIQERIAAANSLEER